MKFIKIFIRKYIFKIKHSFKKNLSNLRFGKIVIIPLNNKILNSLRPGNEVLTSQGVGTLFSKYGLSGRIGVILHNKHYSKFFKKEELSVLMVYSKGSFYLLSPSVYSYFILNRGYIFGHITKRKYFRPTKREIKKRELYSKLTNSTNIYQTLKNYGSKKIKFNNRS